MSDAPNLDAEALREAIATLTRERDEARKDAADAHRCWANERTRAADAEAQAARLREALVKIAAEPWASGGGNGRMHHNAVTSFEQYKIARAALAPAAEALATKTEGTP